MCNAHAVSHQSASRACDCDFLSPEGASLGACSILTPLRWLLTVLLSVPVALAVLEVLAVLSALALLTLGARPPLQL